MKRTFMALLCTGLLLLAAGCGNQNRPETPEEVPGSETAGTKLYITLDGLSFSEYPFTGEADPGSLIAAIGETTGWDMTLADEVTTGRGGMTVSFAGESCLFQGPPEEQREAFHVYDATQMAQAALGSVQRTLQNWASPAAPETVDIYFCTEGDQPLVIPDVLSLPLDQPYDPAVLLEGADPVRVLRNQLSNYYDTADMEFTDNGAAEVDGADCAVYVMQEVQNGKTYDLGYFAITPELTRIYELRSETGAFELLWDLNG